MFRFRLRTFLLVLLITTTIFGVAVNRRNRIRRAEESLKRAGLFSASVEPSGRRVLAQPIDAEPQFHPTSA